MAGGPGVVRNWRTHVGDDVKLTFGDGPDWELDYDTASDEIRLKDRFDQSRNLRLEDAGLIVDKDLAVTGDTTLTGTLTATGGLGATSFSGDITLENGEIIDNGTDGTITLIESGASPDSLAIALSGAQIDVTATKVLRFNPDAAFAASFFGDADTGENPILYIAGYGSSATTWLEISSGSSGSYDDITFKAKNTDGGAFQFLTDTGVGNFIGATRTAPLGQLHIDQSKSDGAIEVLALDQADVSEEYINFIGTVSSGNAIDGTNINEGGAAAMSYGIRIKINNTTTAYLRAYNQLDAP